MWSTQTPKVMQQRLWLACLKLVAIGCPARAVIDLLGAMLVTMREADAPERAHLYTGRLDAMHRTGWRMVHEAQRRHWDWVKQRADIHDDYDVIERDENPKVSKNSRIASRKVAGKS